jgi:REP element-mobilizing transposase RayT
MPQSLSRVLVHLVYSTKNRRPWLTDPAIRGELYAYTATILQSMECTPILMNGVADHVHILCGLSRKVAIMDLVEAVKRQPSKWLKSKGEEYHDFHWQNGYGIFSVSESNVPQVHQYVADQESHHRRMSFQDEFRELCRRHELVVDERYVWE